MEINKKIIPVISVAALIFNLFFPAFAKAYTFSIASGWGGSMGLDMNKIVQEVNSTSISSVSKMIEDRYGFNKDIWRTAQRKVYAPKVEITFDNTNPKIGEKVTAHAMPEFFKNDPQNLYYTWYIIHTADGTSETATNSIADGKIEAARIMARGDYDPELDGQDYSKDVNSDPDSDGSPAIDDSYDKDKSAAPMGGCDGLGGLESDSANTDPSLSEYCGSHTSSDCTLYTDKSSFNSYYQFNGTQTDTYCESCSSQTLSWGTLSSNNQCCYLVANPSDTDYSEYDSGTTYCPTDYSASYESCFDYATLQTTNESAINTCLDSECEDAYNTTHSGSDNAVQGDSSNSFSRCFKHNFGVNSGALGYRGYSGESNTYGNDESGLDYNVACKHKWPNAKTTGRYSCTSDDCTSGSGKFSTGEEKYWRTDPTDPDTDGDGFKDEADVTGLGQQEFSWTYQSGDRVGVVTEGTSLIPTDEQNAYYKIMWGYPDTCDSTKTKLLDNDLCDGSGDYGFGFLATKSPSEEGDENLKISLTSSPDSPVADPSNENRDNIEDDGSILNADQISVTSSLDNTELDPNLLYYTWQIQRGNLKTDEWGKALDISDNFDTTSSSSGLGVTSLSFTPKKKSLTASDDDIIYFKVTATIAKSSGITAGQGRSSVVIPVNKKGVKIDLYKVDISGGKATLGDKVCTEGLYAALCPVVTGQILAAKISGNRYIASNSEFAWQVDGETLNKPDNVSDYFDGWSDTEVFFPINKQEGDLDDITVTVTPANSLVPVTSTRLVTVVEPVGLIRSSDESIAWPKTTTVASSSIKDSSTEVSNLNILETYPSSDVSFYLNFVPSYLLADDKNTVVDWQFGGTSISDETFSDTYGDLNVLTSNDGKDLSFTAPEIVGAYYDVTANLKKYWSEDEVSIMENVWGLTPLALESDSSTTITTVEEATAEDTTSSANPTQLLASIGTHLPHYLMYNLRLALTVLVMLFASFWLYALIKKFTGYEET